MSWGLIVIKAFLFILGMAVIGDVTIMLGVCLILCSENIGKE